MQRTTVFVSYSHRNARWLKRLQVHLKPYEHWGVLELWDDSRIRPGDEWLREIRGAIDRAAAAILLVSPDFLASDFVVTEELPKLLKPAERGGARILPIIIEPCELKLHPELARFHALNSPDEPLADMSRTAAERVLVKAVSEIGKLFPPGHLPRNGHDPFDPPDKSGLYERVHSACVISSVLWYLERKPRAACSVSELHRDLRWQSRKTGVEALNVLMASRWIEKIRENDSTKFRLTKDGIHQIRRLAAACDGPFQRSVVQRSSSLT